MALWVLWEQREPAGRLAARRLGYIGRGLGLEHQVAEPGDPHVELLRISTCALHVVASHQAPHSTTSRRDAVPPRHRKRYSQEGQATQRLSCTDEIERVVLSLGPIKDEREGKVLMLDHRSLSEGWRLLPQSQLRHLRQASARRTRHNGTSGMGCVSTSRIQISVSSGFFFCRENHTYDTDTCELPSSTKCKVGGGIPDAGHPERHGSDENAPVFSCST